MNEFQKLKDKLFLNMLSRFTSQLNQRPDGQYVTLSLYEVDAGLKGPFHKKKLHLLEDIPILLQCIGTYFL